MIWTNGYIQWKLTPESAVFDEDGIPIQQEETWSEFIECGYEDTTTLTAKSRENSDYKQQQLSVRVKLQEPKERLRIYDKGKQLLGEFVVTRVNQYSYIAETHLICSR